MTPLVSNTVAIVAGAILALMIGGIFALTWHGSITGQECITFLSGVTLTGIVGGVSHVAVKAGATAATAQKEPPAK